jgi:hypothetical protein
MSTFLFQYRLGLRFNSWITSGLGGRIRAALAFTVFFVMLLSLFPNRLATFQWFYLIPDFSMLVEGASATVPTMPTLLVVSLLMAVLFNCSLNLPSTHQKLFRMGFKKDFIERNLFI